MKTELNAQIGVCTPDDLIADTNPALSVVMIKATGPIKRGAVLTGTAGAAQAVASSALDASKSVFIACDAEEATGECVIQAYRAGNFNASVVEAATNYTLTAADIEVLRGKGIIISYPAKDIPEAEDSSETEDSDDSGDGNS